MRDHDRPLVSCIMPTRNRRRFARQAIWYFLRQTWEPHELVVIDDGSDAVADLIPRDERIRYIRLDRPMRRGAKRNLACEMARGELIAHWDDDDWMSPDRLRLQVEALLAADAAACGATDLLHYAVEGGRAWSYQPAANGRPHLAGPTLLYRRAAWMAQRFPERDFGEDRAFTDALSADALRTMPDSSFYLALIHGGNTVPRNLADPAWVRQPIDDVVARLGPDTDFYVTIRHGAAARPAQRHAYRPSVTLRAPFMLYDGYGSLSEYLLWGMREAGATVNVVPTRFDPCGYDDDLVRMIEGSQPDPSAPVLLSSWILEPLWRHRTPGGLVMNTMWETSQLPDGTATNLNLADAIAVPSRFVAEMFRDSGVIVPVEVVPYGVDPARYPYEERPERTGTTTLTVGTFVPRKNIDEGIAAWKLAFAGDPDARLIIKTRFRVRAYVPDDPRIQFVDGEETTRGIAHWYRQADVLLALGSEGFGLPLVEGMATGLPVIALCSEGQADVCEEAGPGRLMPVPPVRHVPFDDPPFGPSGVRSVPAVADVAERLRWVDTHRAEARAMGRAASEWVVRQRNIWSMGPAMLDVMERHLQPQRPLRYVRTIWLAGCDEEPGIATYTGGLLGHLRGVRLVTQPPDLRGVRLLHIHYHPSCCDDGQITLVVRQARQAGVPVAVTEHAVSDHAHAHAWEYEADALVALTAQETVALRARWPGRRVEHLPPGCSEDPWTRIAESHLALWQQLERS